MQCVVRIDSELLLSDENGTACSERQVAASVLYCSGGNSCRGIVSGACSDNNVPSDTWKMVENQKLGINVASPSADAEKILRVSTEDYEQMRRNIIVFHRDYLSPEQFRKTLASYL